MSRINYLKTSPAQYQKVFELSQSLQDSTIPQNMRDLVHIRASQMNGCAFCLDMHVKEARIHGERDLRVHHLPVWRESPLFNAKEKTILELTELLTKIPEHGISDAQFEKAREYLSEKEISDLTFDICVINFWNRLNAVSRSEPGSMDKMLGVENSGY